MGAEMRGLFYFHFPAHFLISLVRALEAPVHYEMDASLRRHERAFIRFILFYRIRAFQRKPEDSRCFGTIRRVDHGHVGVAPRRVCVFHVLGYPCYLRGTLWF